MQLTGELKEKVEKAANAEEAKKIIEEAGLELTDEEMDQVAGGMAKDLPWGSIRSGHKPKAQQGIS